MINPEEPITDLQTIKEKYESGEKDGFEYFIFPQKTTEPQINAENEVHYNISAIDMLGHKATPFVYNKTMINKIKLFGLGATNPPFIRNFLLICRKGDIIYIKVGQSAHQHPIRTDELFFRIEIKDVITRIKIFPELSPIDKIERLKSIKEQGDENFKTKDYPKAFEFYKSAYIFFTSIKKKTRQNWENDLSGKYDEMGKKIGKNYMRVCSKVGEIEKGLEVLLYFEKFIDDRDWSFFDIGLNLLKEGNKWVMIEERIKQNREFFEGFNNFKKDELLEWEIRVKNRKTGLSKEALLGKALRLSIDNKEKEQKREHVLAMMDEHTKRLLFSE